MTEEKKALAKAKRLALSELSKKAKKIIEEKQLNSTINDMIIFLYSKKEECKIFKSYKNWKEEGKTVIKGSKGFPIWGRPRKIKGKEETKEHCDKRGGFDFFPIAHLFSEKQVS